MRLVHQCIHLDQCFAIHAQTFQIKAPGILVQQTQHDALAMPGGQCGYAHIDRAPSQAQRNAPILRQSFFGNIQLGHDLDARHHGRMQHAMWFDHIFQRAIDTEAHHRTRFKRFDVNVRSVFAHRLRQQGIDHAYHRRIIFHIEQIFGLRQVIYQLRQIHILLDIPDQRSR